MSEVDEIPKISKRKLRSIVKDEEKTAKAANLSVGQQQRVAAARALIGSPQIIVADEPTSALDRNTEGAFLNLLFAQSTAAGASVIMVSHDESLARYFDRVVRLDEIALTTRGALS